MKAITTLFTICLVVCFTACQGQTKAETTKKKTTAETVKADQKNLIDEEVKMYSSIFDLTGAGEDNPFDKATNFLEVIEKINLPEESKKILREQYKTYDLSLNPKKKDSLKLMVTKMMIEAIAKSQSDLNN